MTSSNHYISCVGFFFFLGGGVVYRRSKIFDYTYIRTYVCMNVRMYMYV